MLIHRLARTIATVVSRRATRALVGTATSAKRHRAVVAATAARWNAANHPAPYLTVAGYMANVLRADADFVRRYAPVLGGHVRRAYAKKYGTNPTGSVLVTVGRGPALAHPRLVNATAYEPGDIAILNDAAKTYERTAALIGA